MVHFTIFDSLKVGNISLLNCSLKQFTTCLLAGSLACSLGWLPRLVVLVGRLGLQSRLVVLAASLGW